MKWIVTATFSLLSCVSILAETVNSFDGSAGDDLWANPANWSRESVPVATEDVLIPAGHVVTIAGQGVDGFAAKSLNLVGDAVLRFELDVLGVEPLRLSGGLTIEAGGGLEVVASNYEGMDGYFPLVLSSELPSAFGLDPVSIVGLEDRAPALVQQEDGLWLRVVEPPPYSARMCALVPESTVEPDYANTSFVVTRELQSTVSAWSPTFHEAHVMDTQLSQMVHGDAEDQANLSWDIRVGRGGHLYSFRIPALGETVPPSWRSEPNGSPWNDEVWQGVAVDTSLNDPPHSRYFIHQSGVYVRDAAVSEPFYSPTVASWVNEEERSYTTINWGQQAHTNIYTDENPNNDWQSHLLYFTRYRDLGQGLIEVSLGFYNYGPDHLNHFNMPWGGVRRTTTEHAFISQGNGTGWNKIEGNFGDGTGTGFDGTGGSIAFSGSETGSSPSLALVYGFDSSPRLTYQTSSSQLRYGYAGGAFQPGEDDWRNYFVLSVIRRYALDQGRGVWSRYYFVQGDDLADLSTRIADRSLTADPTLFAFDYTEENTPLIAYRTSGSGAAFRIVKDGRAPRFFLYAYPVAGSFPIYEIIGRDGSRFLTWNPYATGVIKTYDGTIAGIRLLGFAMRSSSVGGSPYSYESLETIVASVPDNYLASGESLVARTGSVQEAWRIEHFGFADNAGDGADDANPDSDPLNNLGEFAFGGNPTDGNDRGHIPTLELLEGSGADGVEFTYMRRRSAAEHGLIYKLESSTNLRPSDWETKAAVAVLAVDTINSDFETVANRIEFPSKGSEFFRVRVEKRE